MGSRVDKDAILFSIGERAGVAEARRDSAVRWLRSAMKRVEQELSEGADPSPTLLEISRHAADAAAAASEARAHRLWLKKFKEEL